MRGAVFRSAQRWEAFRDTLVARGVECEILDFDDPGWSEVDFAGFDLLIYYPPFEFSSNHPHALSRVKDGLAHIAREYPRLVIYPDPLLYPFYNDKYRQSLFLTKAGFPIPRTVALDSSAAVEHAAESLGFPLVLKNRFGAGGESVVLVRSAAELRKLFERSRMNYWSADGIASTARTMFTRRFAYHLIRERRMQYPLLGWPMLAQQFVTIDRDLKTVVGDGTVVEAHWRRRADSRMWKMNIDGGAVGEWSFVPSQALELSEKIARRLQVRWINLDLIEREGEFLVSEFSPVWHHYRYREKPDFVYRDDYNLSTPLEQALDLEPLIVDSLLRAVADRER